MNAMKTKLVLLKTIFTGKMPRYTAAGVVVAATLLLSGCALRELHNASVSSATAPFFLAYDSEEVIRDQSRVATITSDMGLEIDGVVVNNKNMRSADTGGSADTYTVVVDVLPGTHTIRTHHMEGGPSAPVPVQSVVGPPGVMRPGVYVARSIVTAPITYRFEAGHIYDMPSATRVVENTSEKVVQKIGVHRSAAVFSSPDFQPKDIDDSTPIFLPKSLVDASWGKIKSDLGGAAPMAEVSVNSGLPAETIKEHIIKALRARQWSVISDSPGEVIALHPINKTATSYLRLNYKLGKITIYGTNVSRSWLNGIKVPLDNLASPR